MDKSLYQEIIDDFISSVLGTELIMPTVLERLKTQLAEDRAVPDKSELLDLLRTVE